jgi:hypothetical protein
MGASPLIGGAATPQPRGANVAPIAGAAALHDSAAERKWAIFPVHLDDGHEVAAFSALRLTPSAGAHVVINEALHASGKHGPPQSHGRARSRACPATKCTCSRLAQRPSHRSNGQCNGPPCPGTGGPSRLGELAPATRNLRVHPGRGRRHPAETIKVHTHDVAGAAAPGMARNGGELGARIDLGEEAHGPHALRL